MPETRDHVAFLSQQIGPRPAGTEEEQQAALYITEHLQKEAGLSAVIEDFNSASASEAPRALCCFVTILIAALSLFLPVLAIPAMVVTALAAVLFLAEVLDRPVLSSLFAKGVSQNVVAKYEPGYTPDGAGARRRKVIVVARYDSGKVQSELNGPFVKALPILCKVVLGAMVFVPLLLIVRYVFFLHAVGTVALVFNVLTVVALVVVALPVVAVLMHKFAAYNEGANCNAAGVAVLMDVATRIGRGRVSEAELSVRRGGPDPTLHGEEAAWAAGLVPEGAQLVYEAAAMQPPEPSPQTPESRLAAAKAAVAALSGKPVSATPVPDIAGRLVQVKEPPLAVPTPDDLRETRGETREALSGIPADTVNEALARAAAVVENEQMAGEGTDWFGLDAEAAASASVAGAEEASWAAAAPAAQAADDGVPDWFKKAQEKAKKTKDDGAPVQRSRYADALDAAMSESASHFSEANRAVASETEQRLQQTRAGIMEVKAPGFDRPAESVSAPSAPAGASPLEHAAVSDEAPAASHDEALAGQTCAMPPLNVDDLRVENSFAQPPIGLPAFLQERAERSRESLEVQAAARNASSDAGMQEASSADAGFVADEAPAADPVSRRRPSKRRPIALPDIGTSPAAAPLPETQKQRAPLADVESSSKTAAKSLLTMLPSIDLGVGEEAGDDAGQRQTSKNSAAALKNVLPSLSGSISAKRDIAASGAAQQGVEGADAAVPSASVSLTGAFAAGSTGTFAPVGEELLQNVDPNDIYVDDADDSDYEGNVTETGAFAGPGYVEMPKSRAHRLLDKFRFGKNKDKEEPTPQEWLDVDESFDARSVGAARGSWESFREEEAFGGPASETLDGYDEQSSGPVGFGDPYDGAAGPALASDFEEEPQRSPSVGVPPLFDADDTLTNLKLDDLDVGASSPAGSHDGRRQGGRRRWNGGAFSRRMMNRTEEPEDDGYGEDFLDQPQPAYDAADELDQIYRFRHPDIDTEVWFVALGSELVNNGGMRAFLAEHAQDLRGSVIIDIDALGAGDLALVEREGSFRSVATSSRMKRYVKKASQATGISVASAQIRWKDSAASYAIKHGYQAMHLAGMAGAKPAFFGQSDDVLENIEEEKLLQNSDFVMELLKNI